MKKIKIAYLVTKRNGKSFWSRIGIGFINEDGSVNIKLEAIPVNGEFQLRDYVPPKRRDYETEPTDESVPEL